MNHQQLRRFEGRLFAEGGILFLVVEADQETRIAKVSCRVEGQHHVVEMPLEEVARRLSSSADLKLDNVNGPNAAKRIMSQDGEWFFKAREGLQGPYETPDAARGALARYIVTMQSPMPAAALPHASGGSSGRKVGNA